MSSPPPNAEPSAQIGTLNEGTLHAELKAMLACPGDEFEVPLEGYVIDIRRGDLLIEVQTQSFAAMARKLDALLDRFEMRIVYPVATVTHLHRPSKPARRSPKKLDHYAVLDELVSLPTLIDHPRLSIDVALLEVDRHEIHDPKARRGRGGWRTTDKRIRSVVGWHQIATGADVLALLPTDLPPIFTTADIAGSGVASRDRAQKLTYVLRALGLITLLDAKRTGFRYQLTVQAD